MTIYDEEEDSLLQWVYYDSTIDSTMVTRGALLVSGTSVNKGDVFTVNCGQFDGTVDRSDLQERARRTT